MYKLRFIIILLIIPNLLKAQSVDLSSVDAFFDVTSTLISGKKVSNDQWSNFDNSAVYKQYSNREDKFIINTIKKSIQLVFGKTEPLKIDSILNISKKEITNNKELLIKKLFVENYTNIKDNYYDILLFRNSYNFENLINKSKLKLSSFLGHPVDSLSDLKPVHFFFASADAADKENAIIVDLNLLFRQTEEMRIELIAHEYFHNYRERFENHDFNYKCDLNYIIDMIPNEGIADMIDKTEGYEKYYSNDFYESDLSNIMIELYNSAEKDLERLHNLVIEYSLKKISKDSLIDSIIEIVKFNGHPIGFYMANKIVSEGYRKQMIEKFYNPFEFYKLYNMAAKKSESFLLSDEFINFIFKKNNCIDN